MENNFSPDPDVLKTLKEKMKEEGENKRTPQWYGGYLNYELNMNISHTPIYQHLNYLVDVEKFAIREKDGNQSLYYYNLNYHLPSQVKVIEKITPMDGDFKILHKDHQAISIDLRSLKTKLLNNNHNFERILEPLKDSIKELKQHISGLFNSITTDVNDLKLQIQDLKKTIKNQNKFTLYGNPK